MKKIVTTSVNAEISLPEAPPDSLDIPDAMSSVGGGAMSSGGFGGGGMGGGFGKGMGIGGASGFSALPLLHAQPLRTSRASRKLRQTGGNPECEAVGSASSNGSKTNRTPMAPGAVETKPR
ncbi:MAG: hypothetical protein IPK32_14390 [Verrucomicrobiaceae bacterium]|nr:hypothetical protein [Verrucomicrobiaceae bacterium]